MADTMNLGGAFPIIKFDKLPASMERGNIGRAERTKYNWGAMGVKDGIMVPGNKYMSAASSANGFAKQYPFDADAEKKLANHLRGRIMQAKKAYEADEANKDKPWTDAMAAEVKPDPAFVQAHSRVFRTEAVKDNDGNILRTLGLTTKPKKNPDGSEKPGDPLADNYYIIRTN